ncbi:hypothetical protein GLW00_00755 [Halobacillus litoralis]|uniref:GPI inositol-deacylase PGAP1-like alpha/beta domain-containing protein n=1 Tax=Halobacillus litoralis TaxID=45668 RepID=A0A845F6L0_9BACI|nr:hypothetical protein [Halobacillus litoralis]MYL69355.1 hypothetical protein [Halobacillus litoralis]
MLNFKKWFIVFTAFFLSVPSVSLAGSIKDGTSGNPGEWYVGETPSTIAANSHPILFVHGLNSSSDTWYVNNNMYTTAYQSGYETAFIDLNAGKSMWDNGALLAEKVKEIYNYFGEKVVVVAHSKGGVDTQSALVHYGADPYIERVITLSSPHRGSQLADLAYSSWAGWLAGIIGSKNDGTYSLQTGYMDYYRSVTDNQANVYNTPFYTFGGTKWGSFGSALYWGGLYLSSYGSNDGAVTVQSSRLPYATEISVGRWDHTTIKEGSSTFNLFKDYLNESMTYSPSIASFETAAATEEMEASAGHYVTGGEYVGTHKERVAVEKGVSSVTFDWISDHKNTSLILQSPSNKTYADFDVTADDTEFFDGAYHHSITLKNPESGKWTLETKADQKESYLLNTAFESPVDAMLSSEVEGNQMKVKANKKLNVNTDMTIEYYDKNGKLKEKKMQAKKNGKDFKIPSLGEGVYNMTIDVKGTYDGTPLERTIIQSVYIDDKGKLYTP